MNREILGKRIWHVEVSEWILLFMVVLYSAVFSYYTIMKHYSFRSYAWDLGLMTQSVASAARGGLFTNNAELYYSPTGSFFGVHFSPILFLVVPFFYLVPRVETLLVIQAVVLALGAIPIFLIAKYSLDHRLSGLILSAAYLLNPLLQSVNWYDFHTQAFFPFFILASTYSLKTRKLPLFFLFLVVALTTMEQSSYLLVLYAVYCGWELRKELRELIFSKKLSLYSFVPLIVFLVVVAWILASSTIMQIINPNPPSELKALGNFGILGVNSIAEIPIKAFLNPELALKAINYDLPWKILYVLLTFAPSAFLAVLSPFALLPSLLWLSLSVLSNYPPYYQLGFQYTAFTLPFVSIASLETIRGLSGSISGESLKKLCVKLSLVILIVGVFLSALASPLSLIQKPGYFGYFRDYGISFPSSLDSRVEQLLNAIPKDSRIITTASVFPHISTYPNAFVLPPLNSPSPRLYSGDLEYLKGINYDYVLLTYFWDKTEVDLLYDNFVASDGAYGLYIKGPGLELYKRGYNDPPTDLALKFSYKELTIGDSVITRDLSSESGDTIMLPSSPIAGRYAWYGPYMTLRPGNYTANFRIKLDNLPGGKVIKFDIFSSYLPSTQGQTIASYDVYGKDFTKALAWQTFSITFSITKRTPQVEFRGLEAASNVSLWLDYVEVVPK